MGLERGCVYEREKEKFRIKEEGRTALYTQGDSPTPIPSNKDNERDKHAQPGFYPYPLGQRGGVKRLDCYNE